MRTLVNRVSALGVATIVVVGLSLAAIVEQAMFPTTHSSHRHVAAASAKPVRHRTHTPRPSRSHKRMSPATLLSRQVKKEAAAQRGPVARREYGVGKVAAPVVHVSRMEHTWAFGTEAIPAPLGSAAAPEPSLFLARSAGAHWTVALAGTAEFARLAAKAPTSVLSKEERTVLKAYHGAAKTTLETGLMLPWQVGQSWSAMATEPTAWGFDGGDGRVLAAGDGLLYRLCSSAPDRGLVLVIHPSGLATEYAQMADITPVPDGGAVKQGDYLGRTGTDRACGGGQAPTRLVRFALRDATGPIPLDRVKIGGWMLHSAADAMYADRDGVRVNVGNPLLNFGETPTPTPSPTPAPKHTPKPHSSTSDPKAVT